MFLILLAGPTAAQDTGTMVAILGDVKDAETGQPITDAAVRVVTADRAALTNLAGRFRLEGLRTGTHVFEVRRLGYVTFRFDAELTESTTISVELFPDPVVLDELTVIGDRFGERLRFLPYGANVWTTEDFRDQDLTSPQRFLDGRSPWIDCGADLTACGTTIQGRQHLMAVVVNDSPQPRAWQEVQAYRLDEIHRIEFIRQCAMVRVYTVAYVERVARGEVRIPRSFASDCLMVRRRLRLRLPLRRRVHGR